ncbi:MAG: DUF4010 domain-containing protein, partial [Rhodospirillales bacterium]|nr:DUF4010 domain-containing protein [Rhodospirillales bacterium]
AGLLTALLGGIYSSTVTTVVLARRARDMPEARVEAQSGIVLANSVMYLRLLAIVALFDRPLAGRLALPLIALSALGLALAGFGFRRAGTAARRPGPPPANPLGFGAAASFAILFVIVSLAAAFVARRFGAGGLMLLAAAVGLTDINPFVLSLAQHGAEAMPLGAQAGAVVLATASNNLFQAGYAAGLSRLRVGWAPLAGLGLLAASGIGFTIWLAV